MEGYLCTCSLVCFVNIFFLLICSAVNASQGAFFEDLDQFPFSFAKLSLEEGPSNTHQQAPSASPSDSPAVSPSPHYSKSTTQRPPRGYDTKNGGPSSKKGLNEGQIAGLVLISIAGVLQVVVLAYLLVKRRQMLRVVEKYEV